MCIKTELQVRRVCSPICTLTKSVPMLENEDKSVIEEKVQKDGSEDKEGESYLYIILFYLLGTACFVPHNFYITANEYWMYKFRNASLPFNESHTEQKTTLQKDFTAYAGFVGNIGLVVFLLATIVLAKKISLQRRIIGGMVSLLVLFTVTLFFIFVDTDSWQSEFFVIALGIGGLLNGCYAVLLLSFFQLASRFPARCLAAQTAGQSLCGILSASAQILALLIVPSVQNTATLYYTIATGIVASVMVAFITVLNRSEYFRSKLEWIPSEPGSESNTKIFDKHLVKRVLKKVILLVVALILCVVVSSMLNPGLTSLIESAGKGTNAWSDTYFLPVCVFLLFNIFEFIGREVSNHIEKLKNIHVIFGISVVRLALFPAILLCNLQPRNHLPVVFHDDAYFIIFMILLAVSGGYLQNVAVLVISEVCEPEEKALGLLIILLVLFAFVTISSLLSGAIVNLI